MNFAPLIEEIIRDNLSGAQELASRAGSIVCRLTEEKRSSPIKELRGFVLEVGGALLRAQPAMASLFNLFDRILPELDRASCGAAAAGSVRRATQAFIVEMEEHNRKISAHLFDLVKKEGVVITHSASRSVREALCHCWKEGRRFSVICTESRPACEGALLAGQLAEQGIPTSLTTDALCLSLMMAPPQGKPRTTDLRPWLWGTSLAGSSEHSSPRSRTGRSVVRGKKEGRVVLVGADSVSLHGLTNKAGTLGLAMAARNCSIPFYALAGSEKFLPSTFPVEMAFQERPPEEILSPAPNGLNIINRYFDITPLPYLTAVVTEQGILPPKDLAEQLKKLTPNPQLIAALNL